MCDAVQVVLHRGSTGAEDQRRDLRGSCVEAGLDKLTGPVDLDVRRLESGGEVLHGNEKLLADRAVLGVVAQRVLVMVVSQVQVQTQHKT